MSDFLYSSDASRADTQRELYSSHFDQDLAGPCRCWQGPWGTLVASDSLYDGFAPFENESHVIVVAGGPLLKLPDVERFEGSNRYSRRILAEVVATGSTDWFEYVTGPFTLIIVSKSDSRIRVVTDLLGILPVFATGSGRDRTIGTKLTCVAHLSPCGASIDPAAAGEFTLHGTVAFPFTLYRDVERMAPGLDSTLNIDGKLESQVYWRPEENTGYRSLRDAAHDLRAGLQDNVARICENKSRIGMFLSGGEDSRTILAMVPDGVQVECFTLADSLNREARTARRIARMSGHTWRFLQRNPDHYIKDFHYICTCIGNDVALDKAHFAGLQDQIDLPAFDAVLGGIYSDFLFKGYAASQKHHSIRGFKVWPSKEMPVTDRNVYQSVDTYLARMSRFLAKDSTEVIIRRKLDHVRRVAEFRPRSCAEWWNIWPASQTTGAEQFNQCRRSFRSFEPFTLNNMIQIGASVPINWKLNRKLFHRANRGVLGKLGWVPHPDGWLPALGQWGNIATGAFIGLGRVVQKLAPGKRSTNEYSWPLWAQLTSRPLFKERVDEYRDTFPRIASGFACDYDTLLGDRGLEGTQKMRFVQTLFFARDAG